jgi:hypothetical protein
MRGHALEAVFAGVLLVVAAVAARAQDKSFVIVHDEKSVKDLLPKLTQGAGQASLESKDVYKNDREGKTALKVTGEGGDGQRFNPFVPGWAFEVKEKPQKETEFRYITFAWKKVGGTGIQLQISRQGDWGHRYHAGANERGWNPSIQVSAKLPEKWEIHTRDLWADWATLRVGQLTGMAFTAWSLDYGLWDHVVLHQSKEDPLAALSVDPHTKLAASWAKMKQGN